MNILTENLSAQRIFDHVCLQLALQGGPARIGIVCAYRNNGRACGVGFLLTDDEVNDNKFRVIQSNWAPERLRPFMMLLREIQGAHDVAMYNHETDRFDNIWNYTGVAKLLEGVAIRYGLDKGVLYSAFPRQDAPEDKPVVQREVVDLTALEYEINRPFEPKFDTTNTSWTKWWDALHFKERAA